MLPVTRPRQLPLSASTAAMTWARTPRALPLPTSPNPRRCLGRVEKWISLVSWIASTCRPATLAPTRELRLDLDPWLESAKALRPLIHPNLPSGGPAPPHGHRELAHPEPGFYTVGIKSYGRAPTFLLLTGYEQARSVAAAIGGELSDAVDLALVMPHYGVCVS